MSSAYCSLALLNLNINNVGKCCGLNLSIYFLIVDQLNLKLFSNKILLIGYCLI